MNVVNKINIAIGETNWSLIYAWQHDERIEENAQPKKDEDDVQNLHELIQKLKKILKVFATNTIL